MSPSRHISHPGNATSVTSAQQVMQTLVGNQQLKTFALFGKTYFNVEGEIEGQNQDEIVVVGAHIDSTAANSQPYDPATDDAPGADDDLSGVLGVFEVADRIQQLIAVTGALPGRSIRFALFNAEEQGLKGSWTYAKDLKDDQESGEGPTVKAMIAMDMIGYHESAGQDIPFEIHGTGTAATQYPAVHAVSAQLAAIIKEAAEVVAPSLSAQVYPLAGCDEDPATWRSDHSRFHAQGWPACLVAEDLFADVCTQGDAPSTHAANPHYHTKEDVFAHLDVGYIADIARSVAAAVWMIANA